MITDDGCDYADDSIGFWGGDDRHWGEGGPSGLRGGVQRGQQTCIYTHRDFFRTTCICWQEAKLSDLNQRLDLEDFGFWPKLNLE